MAAASRPQQANSPEFINNYVSWGAGLRAAQFMVLGAKVRALLEDRSHVLIEDVKAMAIPTLRHRILTNYRAEAESITVESIIERLLQHVASA